MGSHSLLRKDYSKTVTGAELFMIIIISRKLILGHAGTEESHLKGIQIWKRLVNARLQNTYCTKLALCDLSIGLC